MIAQGTGGSIILTSSTAGLKGGPYLIAYSASKHGVLAISRTLARELAPHRIRVNSLHPTSVSTPMIQNEATYRMFAPGAAEPTLESALEMFESVNLLPTPWVDSLDVSNAVLYLASDEARFVTGTELKIDAGASTK